MDNVVAIVLNVEAGTARGGGGGGKGGGRGGRGSVPI